MIVLFHKSFAIFCAGRGQILSRPEQFGFWLFVAVAKEVGQRSSIYANFVAFYDSTNYSSLDKKLGYAVFGVERTHAKVSGRVII